MIHFLIICSKSLFALTIPYACTMRHYTATNRQDLLDPGHIFTSVAIKSSGVFGTCTETLKFLNDLGHHRKLTSGVSRVYSYLLQRFSTVHGCPKRKRGLFGLRPNGRLFSITVYLYSCPLVYINYALDVFMIIIT